MSDDELGRQLRQEVPPPGSGYWSSIDDALRRAAGGSDHATPPTDTATGPGRRTSMHAPPTPDTRGRRTLLAAVAAIVALVAGLGLVLAGTGNDRPIDQLAAGDEPTTTTGFDPLVTTNTVAGSTAAGAPVTTGGPGRIPTGDAAAAIGRTCYLAGDAPERRIVFLDLDTSGWGSAISFFEAAGVGPAAELAVGNLRESEGPLEMGISPIDATTFSTTPTGTELWSFGPDSLVVADDVAASRVECSEAEAVVAANPALASIGESFGIGNAGVTADDTTATTVVEPVLGAGRHCFLAPEAGSGPTAIRLDVAPDGTASAITRSDYADGPPAGSVGVATGRFFGPIDLVLDVERHTAGQSTQGTEVWRIDGDRLLISSSQFVTEPRPCPELAEAFGDDATALVERFEYRLDDTIDVPATGQPALVTGAVVGPERDRYRFDVSAAATMQITINATEDNAVFDLIGPGLVLLAQEQTTLELAPIPYPGPYQLIVGPTRGNASYELSVSVTQP